MKSAILNLLGVSVSSASYHQPVIKNYSFDMIKDYMANVHCCESEPSVAAAFLTKDLEDGFKNLIEGSFAKKDTFILHVGSDESAPSFEKFDVVINTPCLKSSLYFDFLSGEVSHNEALMINNSFYLAATLDVKVNLSKKIFKAKVRSLSLQNINDSSVCCPLSDAFEYLYDVPTDMSVVSKRLGSCLDLLHYFPTTAFSDAIHHLDHSA